jgi:hypothetical protein
VNITPVQFNSVVFARERLIDAGISLTGDAASEFETSYRYEEDHGHAHFVDGRLAASAGTID